MTKQKLLLTSVCRPFGTPGEGDSVGAELFHAQVTRSQGPFSPRQVIRVWALDYLAENLEIPTVTLHYPTLRELERELRRGSYSHVGINFVVATFNKVREMVPVIRRASPDSVIVLGGYGTVLPDELLRPYGEVICREEGVGFLRRLLGESADTPIKHPHAPNPPARFFGVQLPGVVGHVTAGLGCPNGCDFCSTSHFFDRRYVRFSETGRHLYEALMETRACARRDGMNMESFVLIDEDFFTHERRAREFLDCVREGGEPLSLFGFGSVRGLSRFSAREIAEMGFTLVWTAFEGRKAGYAKLRGKPLPQLYGDLKGVGCGQLTSMIVGFPYQDEAIIRREFDQLMALEPTMMQCLIYFALPGTPFHDQVVAENRYRAEYRNNPDLRRWDGFSMHLEHPEFEDPSRVEALQRELYRRDFARLGPSVLRLARVSLTGYENLRSDANPLLAARAQMLRRQARSVLPLIGAAINYAPSSAARSKARSLRRDLIRLTGRETARERLSGAAGLLLYWGARAAQRANVLQQPQVLRTSHRNGDRGNLSEACLNLQHPGLFGHLGALRDDVMDRFARFRVNGGREPFAKGEAAAVTNPKGG